LAKAKQKESAPWSARNAWALLLAGVLVIKGTSPMKRFDVLTGLLAALACAWDRNGLETNRARKDQT